jgi:hypothetical protein
VSSLASFSQWLQDLDFFTALRESGLPYPIILSLHLTCIAVFGGMILMTDLRLLGLVMRSTPVSDMIRQLRPWKALGFVIMITCGSLLAGAKLANYYDNPYFQIKLTLLLLVGVHAWVFHRSVYGKTANLDSAAVMPRVAKVAACLSMVLWLGIMSMGRWIAYYERPKPTAAQAVSKP